ncbi:HhH-GDP family DNA glycosylase [Faecalibacter bovis]|uniref:Uncharacterized protein n=1 Tax=Faecalibacter bovis TaxID=2898187 RepID=A0ABX7XB41_9FLAO|nr:hypothetical protein [Faecalibacter bovis]QTV05075.1 hypothetical protein J9309_09765 [Faecalibacter bovis]
MEQKTKQIKQLTEHLLEKYGSENILVTDYWDADNTAIGLADKTKKYTVYITNYGRPENVFYVSLENPTTTEDFPYTPGGEFDNLSAEEVEKILIKHLKLTE